MAWRCKNRKCMSVKNFRIKFTLIITFIIMGSLPTLSVEKITQGLQQKAIISCNENSCGRKSSKQQQQSKSSNCFQIVATRKKEDFGVILLSFCSNCFTFHLFFVLCWCCPKHTSFCNLFVTGLKIWS